MSRNDKIPEDLGLLTMLSLDKEVTQDQLDQLGAYIKTNPAARLHYFRLLQLHSDLRNSRGISKPIELLEEQGESQSTYFEQVVEDSLLDSAIHEALLNEQERQAQVERDEPQHVRRNHLSRPDRRQVFQAISRIAAGIVFAVVVTWMDRVLWRVNQSVPMAQVAQVTQLMGVLESESTGHHYYSGEAVYSEVCVLGKGGYVELVFPSQVKAIVEGPARFEIRGFNQVYLLEGKLFARVPTEGIGFTVNSPSARIVDLGTEFGLEVWKDGTTDVYTYDGQVQIAGSASSDSQESIIVSADEARQVDHSGQTIHHIEFHERKFAREIDAQNEFVWRGQDLNLADIVGGGDGFGTGRLEYGIDLNTGRPGRLVSWKRQGDNSYHPVPMNAFVDGVFVPDGGAGPVQISSGNHVYQDCPDTCGLYYSDMSNGGSIATAGQAPYLPLVLDGQIYGTEQNPAMILHANGGITFDLAAIRDSLSSLSITGFKAIFALSEKIPPEKSGLLPEPTVDIAVLVDGRPLFSRSKVMIKDGGIPIDLPLSESDRFLTLVVTDGAAAFENVSVANDYTFFAEPVLELGR